MIKMNKTTPNAKYKPKGSGRWGFYNIISWIWSFISYTILNFNKHNPQATVGEGVG